MTEEAKIDLVLVSQQYLSGLSKVEGQTDKTQKAVEKAFMKLSTDANRAAASYDMLGDQSKKLATDQKAIQSAIDALIRGGLSKQSPQVQALIADYRKLSTESNTLSSRQKELAASTKRAADEQNANAEKWSNFKSTLAGSIGVAVAVSAAVYKAGEVLIGLASSIETVKMEFEVLTGSQVKANKLFDEMNGLAAKTPLELSDITKAGKQLLAVGIPVGDITEKLRMLGDVAMGNPEKLQRLTEAFAQLKSKGVASMETLNRFIEAGVPIMDELGKQTGKSGAEIFKMVSAGKIGYPEVTKALESLTGQGGQFHDMMAKVATTTAGKFSTAMDGVKMSLAAIGDKTLPAVNKALDEFNKFLDILAAKRTVEALQEEYSAWKKLSAAQKENTDNIVSYHDALQKGITYNDELAASEGISAKKRDEYLAASMQLRAELNKIWPQYRLISQNRAQADALAAKGAKNIANAASEALVDTRLFYAESTKGAIENKVAMEQEAQAAAKNAAMFSLVYDGAIEHAAALAKKNIVVKDLAVNTKDLLRAEGNAYSPEILALINEINGKLAEKKSIISGITSAWGTAQGAMGAYGDLVQNQGDAEIAAMKARGATDEEIKKKQNEINEKAFNANKANAIANALISGYESTMKAYAQLGPLGGTVGAGIVAAISAAQVGMIAAQSYVPMAEGGSGTVTKPTLFLAGEAGAEDFAFGPKRKGGLSGGGTTVIQNFNIGGSVIAERQVMQLGAAGVAMAGRGY
jgi:tape measure domain-containing protein